LGPGCVKTRLSPKDAQNCFLNCLLLREVASAIGFDNDRNSTRNFNIGVFTQPGSFSDFGASDNDVRLT
jgi:hypothetical protein